MKFAAWIMALDWEFIRNAVGTNELSEDQDDAQAEMLYDQLIQVRKEMKNEFWWNNYFTKNGYFMRSTDS